MAGSFLSLLTHQSNQKCNLGKYMIQCIWPPCPPFPICQPHHHRHLGHTDCFLYYAPHSGVCHPPPALLLCYSAPQLVFCPFQVDATHLWSPALCTSWDPLFARILACTFSVDSIISGLAHTLGPFFKLNRSMLSYEIPCEWPLGITEDNNTDEGISNPPCHGDMDGMGKEGAAEHLLLPACFVELQHKSNGWGLSLFSQSPIPSSTLSSFASLITTTPLCKALLPFSISIVSAEEEVTVCGDVSRHKVSSDMWLDAWETILGVKIYESAGNYYIDCANSILDNNLRFNVNIWPVAIAVAINN